MDGGCGVTWCCFALVLQVGTLVPVDPKAMFTSVVQLVLAPVIVGTTLNQYFPRVSIRCWAMAAVELIPSHVTHSAACVVRTYPGL